MDKNSSNNQNKTKPTGDFNYRGGAQSPTFRKPSPPPAPKTDSNNKK